MLPDPSHTFEINVTLSQALLRSENPPLLIDCREINEYTHCRIDGATLVPLSDFMGAAEAEFSSSEVPAIIYCHHGVRSLNAVFYLREQGFTHTYSMAGGIDQWSLSIDSEVPRY